MILSTTPKVHGLLAIMIDGTLSLKRV